LYVELEQQRGVLSPNVIIARRQVICRFLLFLEECGHQSLETVQPSDIRAYIPELAKRQPKGIIYTLPIIHNFCRVLNEKGIQGQAWADILDVKLPVTKVVRMPFTRAEAEKLLKAPNTETPMGLRDAAMMLLAARTGLRAIDIINLKLSNIDWRANEITIVQHKTGKALSLPLFADVGNAISSYILHGRPNSDSEYVFRVVSVYGGKQLPDIFNVPCRRQESSSRYFDFRQHFGQILIHVAISKKKAKIIAKDGNNCSQITGAAPAV
jgi:site-specific recombinase XerD